MTIVDKHIKFEEFYSTKLECGLQYQEKNHLVPPHTHDFIEITCQLNGTSIQGYNSNEITLHQNEILIMNTEQIHENFNTNSDVINILISPKLLTNMIIESSFDPYIINLKNILMNHTHISKYKLSNRCNNLLNLLVDNFHNHGNAHYLQTRLLVIQFLIRLCEDTDFNIIENKHVDLDVISYIHENLRTASLNEFAKLMNLAPSTTSNKIRDLYNLSYLDILHDSRISKAAELLTSTNNSIDHIVYTVGYENKSYFYKLFKQKFQLTPKEYRKLHQ